MTEICSIDGCNKQRLTRGWCSAHYTRWKRHGDPLGGRTANGEIQKWFEDHVGYSGNDCLPWPYAKTQLGYGQCIWRGTNWLASRVMCLLAHGEPPTENHQAAHSCGNGHLGCVNPKHLRWATAKENCADRKSHGTHLCGEQKPMAKLTEQDIHNIRSTCGTNTEIAQEYGVAAGTVSQIRLRKAWRHVS